MIFYHRVTLQCHIMAFINKKSSIYFNIIYFLAKYTLV